MKRGIVKEYDPNRGFGFIQDENGDDYFVHVSGLRPHLQQRGLRPGQRVLFDVDFDVKGDRAINVRPE
ncbi:MAG: cold-shock protein [FCB group bacterium]|nr:cold-shock protein [FCB group bacterium]